MIEYENHSLSFAYLTGQLEGPPGRVVDADTGEPLAIGGQNYGHTQPGREVLHGRLRTGYVIDVQHPADTPPELRDSGVSYSAHEAQLRSN